MAALRTSMYWLFVGVLTFVSADLKAESGQNVTLTCRAPNNNIRVIEWRRPDLKPEYVLVYRDEVFVPDDQHPSFKNRVDLQNKQMKDGDVSLILKDVTINDTGTYKCRVFMEETLSWELISIIYLSVVPPGPPGGSVGLIVGLSVSAVLLGVAAVGFLIYRKSEKQHKQDPYQPANELQPA